MRIPVYLALKFLHIFLAIVAVGFTFPRSG